MKDTNFETERNQCLSAIRNAYQKLSSFDQTDPRYYRMLDWYTFAIKDYHLMCEQYGVNAKADPEYRALMMEIKLRRW